MSEIHELIRIVYDNDYGDPYTHNIVAENNDYAYYWTTMYSAFEIHRFVKKRTKTRNTQQTGRMDSILRRQCIVSGYIIQYWRCRRWRHCLNARMRVVTHRTLN